nr:hypothetical protein [uncultured Desulfobacter sp.]
MDNFIFNLPTIAYFGMPSTLKEAGAKEKDLETMAEKAVERGNLGILTLIGKEDALQIMSDAF